MLKSVAAAVFVAALAARGTTAQVAEVPSHVLAIRKPPGRDLRTRYFDRLARLDVAMLLKCR